MTTALSLFAEHAPAILGSIPGLIAGGAGWLRAHSVGKEADAARADAEKAKADADKARATADLVEAEAEAKMKDAIAEAMKGMRADLELSRSMAQEAIDGLRKCERREVATQSELAEMRGLLGLVR